MLSYSSPSLSSNASLTTAALDAGPLHCCCDSTPTNHHALLCSPPLMSPKMLSVHATGHLSQKTDNKHYLGFNSSSRPSLSTLNQRVSDLRNCDPNLPPQLQCQHEAQGTWLRTGKRFQQQEKKATSSQPIGSTAAPQQTPQPMVAATPCQVMGRVGERQGQTCVTANPQATLLHLLWPKPKSSLSSSKQEATAELHDTHAHPKQPPKLLPLAFAAVSICKEESIYICKEGCQGCMLPVIRAPQAEHAAILGRTAP